MNDSIGAGPPVTVQLGKTGSTSLDKDKIRVRIQESYESSKTDTHKFKRIWGKNSAAILIQSLWRGYWVRKTVGKHIGERSKYATLIQKHVRGFLLRLKLKRDLENLLKETHNDHLLFSPEEYQQYIAIRKIEDHYINVYKKNKAWKNLKSKSAVKIQSKFKSWRISRYELPFINDKKIYILKSQQRTFICMLRALSNFDENQYHPANSVRDRMAPEFFQNLKINSRYNFTDLFKRIKDCSTIKVIRFPDIENLKYSSIPLVQFITWLPYAKMANSWEHKSITNVSVVSKYQNKEDLPLLKKLRIRGCNLTSQEIEKLKDLKLSLDSYLDLIEFEIPSKEFSKELFILTLKYNEHVHNKDLPIFLPLYESLILRVKAACTIQACWRGYKERSQIKIGRDIVVRRCVYTIQRWWRFLKFSRRFQCLVELKSLLSEINTPTVYLEEHFFQFLNHTESAFTILEQNFTFYCAGDRVYVTTQWMRKFLPDWLGVKAYYDQYGGTLISSEEKTLQAVVLSGAKVEIVSLYSEVSEKPYVTDAYLKFLKVEYNSVAEARLRTTIIFLKTLDHKSNTYIPFLSKKALEHSFLMSRLRKVWKARNIDHKKPCPAITILEKALYPVIETDYVRVPEPPSPESQPTILETKESETQESVSPVSLPEISYKELIQDRVKRCREETRRRQTEAKLAKDVENEAKIMASKENKERTQSLITIKESLEFKEKILKRNFVKRQIEKKKYADEQRAFINNFAQAKNMIQKLMKKSDLDRWKFKTQNEINTKVSEFKQKSQERRELVQSMLYEKFKAKQKLAEL
ncbi:unnamed protein product [Blepharisma stoltei]|uniref:IQ calmodulin-binding motif family protein n=1 Tax=Blepharisma stoltei TaxID=1481888 RepID=A0AAU9I813_9CILI|nr:unnamed protein product [Blepharisma stoltei]